MLMLMSPIETVIGSEEPMRSLGFCKQSDVVAQVVIVAKVNSGSEGVIESVDRDSVVSAPVIYSHTA